jgi:hypothetical protein
LWGLGCVGVAGVKAHYTANLWSTRPMAGTFPCSLYKDRIPSYSHSMFFPKFSTLKIFQIKPYCIASSRKYELQFVQLGKKWTHKKLKI